MTHCAAWVAAALVAPLVLACGGHDPNATLAASDCEVCHAGDDEAHEQPQPERCVGCHSNQQWLPLDSSGHDDLFPISRGHHSGFGCDDCHVPPTGFFDFSCIDCHTHSRDRTDRHHGGVDGYAYESSRCLHCHPGG